MLFCSEIFMCYKESYSYLHYEVINVIILIENCNVFMKEEFLVIFG